MNTVKPSTKERKSIVEAYIASREQYWWTLGIFRCFDSEKGKEKCGSLCELCRDYYVDK